MQRFDDDFLAQARKLFVLKWAFAVQKQAKSTQKPVKEEKPSAWPHLSIRNILGLKIYSKIWFIDLLSALVGSIFMCCLLV